MLNVIAKNICTVFGLGNFSKMPGTLGSIAGIFLGFYGSFRFVVEFVRQPDAQFLNQEAMISSLEWMTRGQWLCVPMIFLGVWFLRDYLINHIKR